MNNLCLVLLSFLTVLHSVAASFCYDDGHRDCVYNDEACTHGVPGCSYNSVMDGCWGVANGCYNYNSQGACNAQYGCYWDHGVQWAIYAILIGIGLFVPGMVLAIWFCCVRPRAKRRRQQDLDAWRQQQQQSNPQEQPAVVAVPVGTTTSSPAKAQVITVVEDNRKSTRSGPWYAQEGV